MSVLVPASWKRGELHMHLHFVMVALLLTEDPSKAA